MKTDDIYALRKQFSIIGLTGRTGSGCSDFADIISHDISYDNNDQVRKPVYVYNTPKDELADNNTVFKRKYAISYNYFKKHNKSYKKISYLSVIIFYSIHYGVSKGIITNDATLIEFIQGLIQDNFKEAIVSVDPNYTHEKIPNDELGDILSKANLLFTQFNLISPDLDKIREASDLKSLSDCFFGTQFKEFTDELFKLFARTDYYLGSNFIYSVGNKIRATGNPLTNETDLKKDAKTDHVYSIVKVINKLIKAWKNQQLSNSNVKEHDCLICIDSLRNSLEVMFLKERYSAFYMIAIHNDEKHKENIKDRITQLTTKKAEADIDLIAQKVYTLDTIEHISEEFKNGYFYIPDVENCIQKSDIHISNPGNDIDKFDKKIRRSTFYTMTEQWIKIKSLILHPGLITPSNEERCMQIAFNSKFNSGCISRQVGAVITDENNSIRSVGWNDVPKGSIPCNLRNLSDIINPKDINKRDESYSPFERELEKDNYEKGGNFSSKSKKIYEDNHAKIQELGLNYSFCFKSLHNKYENKDNQVHTRSLHAEENAMLQISKYGGQPLKNGTLYTTASPCELCAKKAYQLGLRIVYIDPYPGISMKHILVNGYNKPQTRMFKGIIGRAYNKLFEPFLSYKDELSLLSDSTNMNDSKNDLNEQFTKIVEGLLGQPINNKIDIDTLKKHLTSIYLTEKLS